MLESRRSRGRLATDGRHIAVALWAAAVLAGCSADAGYQRYEGSTMGTYYRVTARCPESADDVGNRLTTELDAVNSQMSTYDPDSTLSRFNRSEPGAWFSVSRELHDVVAAAADVHALSDGAFDVTVGPLVNLWGFGPDAAGGVPSESGIAAARARVGAGALAVRANPPALRKTKRLYVDLSAIAKGHGVDRLTAVLEGQGCDHYLVDIGGEVRVRGANPDGNPWRIGVEVPDPDALGGLQRVLTLRDAAVATSGDYRNFRDLDGDRVSHTIDPRTGRPVDHGLASVTVVHGSAMRADGLATAINVLGPVAGLALAESEGLAALLIVHRDAGFEELYTAAMESYLADL